MPLRHSQVPGIAASSAKGMSNSCRSRCGTARCDASPGCRCARSRSSRLRGECPSSRVDQPSSTLLKLHVHRISVQVTPQPVLANDVGTRNVRLTAPYRPNERPWSRWSTRSVVSRPAVPSEVWTSSGGSSPQVRSVPAIIPSKSNIVTPWWTASKSLMAKAARVASESAAPTTRWPGPKNNRGVGARRFNQCCRLSGRIEVTRTKSGSENCL